MSLAPTDTPIHSNPDMPMLEWTHRLSRLGTRFFTPLQPTPLAAPAWAARNEDLRIQLGWPSAVFDENHLQAFAGNALLVGSLPLATVYSGHQFGQWAGQLGDGRAIWLGEAQSAQGPQEIQLKGAGRTPYSRGGDGRAVLRSSIREYLCSEAMHGLGIPTTRALCLVASPEPVRRETLESAAVVTRIAPSFLRFGHFEHFSAQGDVDSLRTLADHAILHHLPECQERAALWQGNVYAALLDVVQERTALMLAQWQAVGFCHGVMNTDNMSLLGLTIDYGPFQFMDGFDPGHICNHSDYQGRYAYGRQPNVAYWNLYCLAQALGPLIDDHDLTLQVLEGYKTLFPRCLGDAMRAKLGLVGDLAPESEREADWSLVEDVMQLMSAEKVDFTLFWRQLSQAVVAQSTTSTLTDAGWSGVTDMVLDRPRLLAWLARYTERTGQSSFAAMGQQMLRTNPKFVLRNHLAETAIRQAKLGDFSEIEVLHNLLKSPFDEHSGMQAYADLPPDWAGQLEISCSS
ncbi:protein adenylyltransferase SelO [Limnohabitans sp. Rim8]|uniref:protein adenylyltransferase SelO n=1 Tax=Limnohabitans sp. Rim8 TaxID=1100718 RepID=UPI002628B990|nr:YdiU family protein [Limnohabitans sp. Rim8]